MPDPLRPPRGRRRHGRHEPPPSRRACRALAVSWLLGILWLVGCLVAFAVGFGLTGVSAVPLRTPLSKFQVPGFGAAFVGLSAATFVFIVGAQVSLLREERRHRDPLYRGLRYGGDMTYGDVARHSARLAVLVCVPMAVAGLVIRHFYG
jgi:hypothetical protein